MFFPAFLAFICAVFITFFLSSDELHRPCEAIRPLSTWPVSSVGQPPTLPATRERPRCFHVCSQPPSWSDGVVDGHRRRGKRLGTSACLFLVLFLSLESSHPHLTSHELCIRFEAPWPLPWPLEASTAGEEIH